VTTLIPKWSLDICLHPGLVSFFSPPPAPPRASSTTTNRPPPHLKQPLWPSLSPLQVFFSFTAQPAPTIDISTNSSLATNQTPSSQSKPPCRVTLPSLLLFVPTLTITIFEQWNVNYNSRSTVHVWTLGMNSSSCSVALGRKSFGPIQMAGLCPTHLLKKNPLGKHRPNSLFWADLGLNHFGRFRQTRMGSAHIDGSGPTHIFNNINYNIRITYIIILYIIKK